MKRRAANDGFRLPNSLKRTEVAASSGPGIRLGGIAKTNDRQMTASRAHKAHGIQG